jgi:RNA polymerase sigma factor, sigma-70 family
MKYTQKDLSAIFNKYKTKIYYLALKISRNTDDASDILQNTFLKVIQNLDKFRNESSLSTWIYRIAINEAYMKWRVSKRQQRLADFKKERDLLNAMPPVFPDKEVINEELKEEIDAAVKKLPLKYRVAVILRDFQDLDYAKIGQILKLSLQTTKTRIRRARLELRKAISDYYKDRAPESLRRLPQTAPSSCRLYIKFLDNLFNDQAPSKIKVISGAH